MKIIKSILNRLLELTIFALAILLFISHFVRIWYEHSFWHALVIMPILVIIAIPVVALAIMGVCFIMYFIVYKTPKGFMARMRIFDAYTDIAHRIDKESKLFKQSEQRAKCDETKCQCH